MQKAYDRKAAEHLVPLLESITREITERGAELTVLCAQLPADEDPEPSPAFFDLNARVAGHKRAIRLAYLELERLGCTFDEQRPCCVRIPGSDGSFEVGFEWDANELELRSLSTSSAA